VARFDWTKIYNWLYNYFITEAHFGCSLVDNFDSYNNGDLNGQGSWSGDAEWDVQGTVVQAGAKAIQCATHAKVIAKSFTAEGDGNQVFYGRSSAINAGATNHQFRIQEGDTILAYILFNETGGGTMYLQDGDGSVSLGSWSAGSWVKVEVEWRTSDNTVRARINDGTWTAYRNTYAAFTNVDKISLSNADGTGSTFYVDSFSDPNASQTYTKTHTINSFLKKVSTKTHTADSSLKSVNTKTYTTDSVLYKTSTKSHTIDSYLEDTFTKTHTTDSALYKKIAIDHTTDSYLISRKSLTHTTNAYINYVGIPRWSSPSDEETITDSTPELEFYIPSGSLKIHFEIQLDTVNTFDSGNLREIKSWTDNTNWEYYDGADWQPFPESGVDPSYSGNKCRYTIQSSLSEGTWYRKVRGRVML